MSETTQVQTMTLGTVVIRVPDVETLDKCKEWYQALGLRKLDLDQPGESYWFDVGKDVLLGIHTGAESRTTGFTIYLNVPDVDQAYQRLKTQGFEFTSEPVTKFWGRSAPLVDPAGANVVLVTEAE